MTAHRRPRSTAPWAVPVLGILAFLMVVAASPAIGQATDFVVRDTEFGEDGTTSILVALSSEQEQALTSDRVQVTENGTVISDVEVEPIGQSDSGAAAIAVALVIDTSTSTEGAPLTAAKEAASQFVADLADVDAAVILIEFNSQAAVAAPLTQDLGTLAGPIGQLEADGDTALYDAVLLAAAQLSQVDAQRTMVVFSDGDDTVSAATEAEAIDAATNAEAPITSVVLTSPDLDAESLRGLAEGSGGSVIAVDSADQLAGAFEAVATGLTNQYVITYDSDLLSDELGVDVTLELASGSTTQSFATINPRARPREAVAPPAAAVEAGLAGSDAVLVVGIAATFVALVALLYTLFMTPRTQAARLLDRELTKYVEGGDRRASPSAVAEALRRRASTLLEKSPSGAQFNSRVQKMLDQAALPVRTVELIAIILVSGMLLATIGFVVAQWRGVIVFLPVGLVTPWLFVVMRRAKRLGKFLELLPDTLQLMAGSLSAGYGVLQSIDMVTKESVDPMSTELHRVLVESRLGMPLETSLEAMADRMDSDDFRWVVLAMNIQREVGGNLAQLMGTVATTLRNREALRRHIKALAAEGKLSAIVLVALPIFLAGYLVLINPDYVGTLVESLLGWLLIGGGVIGMIVGMIWIRGLIRAIEV